MKRIFLLFLVLAFLRISIYAQHSFPPTNWCNTNEGRKTKGCRALYGMKFEEKEKVIAIVAVQNVRSNLFMDIEGSSTESDAFSVQSSRDTDKRGLSLWVIEPLSSEHVVRIKNVHSGKYLCLKRLPQPGENLKVTQVELTQETETSTVWMLEMIY